MLGPDRLGMELYASTASVRWRTAHDLAVVRGRRDREIAGMLARSMAREW
jgi:hypothetical protein